jgi:hypothetical protein
MGPLCLELLTQVRCSNAVDQTKGSLSADLLPRAEVSHPLRTLFAMNVNQGVQITCANGVYPHLVELEQHSTYRGLLDGGPTHELNEQLLTDITEYQGQIPTHLVRPTERVLEGDPRYPLAALPHRRCTGLFGAGTHRLQIVWFQDGWAPPIDPAVLEELTYLDFMAVAFDEMSIW